MTNAITHADATAYVAKHFAADAIEILHTIANEEEGAVDVIFSLEGGAFNMTVWNEPGVGIYGEW